MARIPELIKYYFDVSVMVEILPSLLGGAVFTLQFTLLGELFGTAIGLVLALMKISSLKGLRLLSSAYIELFRGTPLLMQIIFVYYALPFLGIELSPFVAAVVSLSLNTAAYCAEIFRAGIQSIDHGQIDAANSLGMDPYQAFRFVVFPQALRRVVPPLTNSLISLLKDSSLISVIAVPELLRTAREALVWKMNPSAFTAAAAIYLFMTLPISRLVSGLETRWRM